MFYTDELMEIKNKEYPKVNCKMDIPLTYEHYKNKQMEVKLNNKVVEQQ